MSLADDIHTAIARPPEKQCKLFHLGLSDTDLEAVLLYVEKIREDKKLKQADRCFTVAGLTEILNSNGHRIGKTVISEHVGKVCACER